MGSDQRGEAAERRRGRLTISIAEIAEGREVEPGAGEEAAEEAGPVLHPPEPRLDQRGQLADVAFSQVGQGSLQVRPH